jgi:hypothetical protein
MPWTEPVNVNCNPEETITTEIQALLTHLAVEKRAATTNQSPCPEPAKGFHIMLRSLLCLLPERLQRFNPGLSLSKS